MKKDMILIIYLINILCVVLIASTPLAALADGVDDRTPFPLTRTLKTGVKSVLNERVYEGTRLGAVVRLYNSGNQVETVPRYEVRAVTDSGIQYTLQPSMTNAKSVQPMETVELSYMIVVNRQDRFSLEKLMWVSVDEYVYPKKETIHLSVPIAAMEWKGSGADVADSGNVIKWGASFALPDSSAALSYRTVQYISRHTPQHAIKVVALHVRNTGERIEWVPDFRIDGKTNASVHHGWKLEQDRVSIEPGGERYLYFAIPSMEPLSTLTVVTPESFVSDDQTETRYTVGSVQIQLPSEYALSRWMAVPYKLQDPIPLDSLYVKSGAAVDMSIVELQRFENVGEGYQTATAKLRLTNRGNRPMPLPEFQMEWMTKDGYSYAGTRQQISWSSLMPNLNYVVNYSFKLPVSDKDDASTIHLLQSPSGLSYAMPIASVMTAVQKDTEDTGNRMLFYPFELIVNKWSLNTYFQGAGSSSSYAFKLKADVELKLQNHALVDSSTSRITFELVDAAGQVLGSHAVPLTGDGRMTGGEQTFLFESMRVEQLKRPIQVHLYETFDTPEGKVNRFLKTLQ